MTHRAGAARGPGVCYRIRGLAAREAGRDTALPYECTVLWIQPNESSFGLETDVLKLRMKFFC